MFLLTNKISIYSLMFLLLLSIVYAAGSGGGGTSSCGLCFTNSRDTILLYIRADDSKQLTLTNKNKFNIIVHEIYEDKTAYIGLNEISETFNLSEGSKVSVDLNNDGFYDLEINYVKKVFTNAQLRIIDLRNMESVPEKIGEEIIEEELIILEEPVKIVDISSLKCNDPVTLRDRVKCRLSLESDELEEELKLNYLPEECRALSGSERGLCIASYKSVQNCWDFPVGDKRISCVKKQIKLENLAEEKEKCKALTGFEKSTCVNILKNKVYSLIKWHFYDLEERAEDLMERGISDKEEVVDFVSILEQKKIDFNKAKTNTQRKSIISAVRFEWKNYVTKIKIRLKS